MEFIIKWKNYDDIDDNSWERTENLLGSLKILKTYCNENNILLDFELLENYYGTEDEEEENTDNFMLYNEVLKTIRKPRKNIEMKTEVKLLDMEKGITGEGIYLVLLGQHFYIIDKREIQGPILMDGANNCINDKDIREELETFTKEKLETINQKSIRTGPLRIFGNTYYIRTTKDNQERDQTKGNYHAHRT